MFKNLKKIYRQEFFKPRLISLLINPFHFARLGLYCSIKKFTTSIAGNLLDVGCGSKPYQELFSVKHYVGLEIDTPSNRAMAIANYFYDGTSFPFSESQFDSVLCSQTLEHVSNPDYFMEEVSRVLKPSGKLLLTVPFVWDEHEMPNDYLRYSSFGIKLLLNKHGLRVVDQVKTCADSTILFQLINAYLYKIFENRSVVTQLILTLTLVAFFNILGTIIGKILPNNLDLYLDNVVLAEKIP